MGYDRYIDNIRVILNENSVSGETVSCIMKLLIADKFKNLDDIKNKYARALNDIKMVLENEKAEDFECVDKIVTIFENLDIGVEYRHDY